MPTRRQFLLATTSTWLAQGTLTPPARMYAEGYENWDGAITAPPLWTCAPRTTDEVVDVVNWAHEHSYRVRPRGFRHGWSPLTVAPGESDNVILVDTTQHLTAMSMSGNVVRVQAGASMEDLLTFLHGKGLGLGSVPAPGDVTIGGVLAIGGHGTGVRTVDEPGHRFGSVSDLVRSITAVVWDGGRYVARTYRRDDPVCAVLLTNLGRAFVTEVTLETGPDVNLRCRCTVDIPATVLSDRRRPRGR